MHDDILERVLVTGSDGALGKYVDFGIRTNRQSLDFTDFQKTINFVRRHKPAAILHLGALTDLAKCEIDPSAAYLVNAVGTYHLAFAAREAGARMIYLSSAGVFDGKKSGLYSENDRPDPPNVYGHAKYLGELAVRGLLSEKEYLIIRTCWVFGGGPEKDKRFIGKIMSQLKNPDVNELKGVSDQAGSPTYAKDLIAAIKDLIIKKENGIVHIANAGVASRYDVAKAIAAQVAPKIPVTPVPLAMFDPKFPITMNESLSSRIGLLRPWNVALKDYLTSEWQGK